MERILIIGTSGMLGSAMFRLLKSSSFHEVFGTVRSLRSLAGSALEGSSGLVDGVDTGDFDSVIAAFAAARPTVVVNCVGLVKQLATSEDPLAVLPINSLLPHRLARLAAATGARLVHISTDCVFSGKAGGYVETDPADAQDLYGRSKFLGEVSAPNAVTLRTSIIGHELQSAHGLVGWFLAQSGTVKGFTHAIFSGLPTVVLAEVVRDHVIPNRALSGVYHVSSAPIDKFSLLKLVAEVYAKATVIVPDAGLRIDRSLDSTRFRAATGFAPDDWPSLVRRMHAFH